MAPTERPIVIGIFGERALADEAIDELRHAGFRDDEIRLAGHARAGGLLEHLASTLSGQAAADGNLPDELVRKGIPEEEARYYQQELEAGRAIVMVESYGHQQEARDILHRYGAYDASARPTQAEGDRIIPVREEELRVHKQLVATGEVVIRKEVITEEKTITVTVQREGVVIERLPLSSPGTPGVEPTGTLVELAPGQTIRIPIREEQVLLEKRPLVTHELIVGKRTVQETQRFIETVRREEPRLERQGEVIVHASTGENDGA